MLDSQNDLIFAYAISVWTNIPDCIYKQPSLKMYLQRIKASAISKNKTISKAKNENANDIDFAEAVSVDSIQSSIHAAITINPASDIVKQSHVSIFE